MLLSLQGGGFQFALNIGGMFMQSDREMVTAESRNNDKTKFYASYPEGVLYKGPLMIYTDRLSASASEVLVSGLHDNCRAVTTGERTFGKGKIQAVFGLADGEGLTMTVAQYVSPKGKPIQYRGIEPDIPADLPANPYVNAIFGTSMLKQPDLNSLKFDLGQEIISKQCSIPIAK